MATALNASRTRFQRIFQRTLHRILVYVDTGFSGAPVLLKGTNAPPAPARHRTTNSQIGKNFQDHPGGPIATFDLSGCYPKLDQKEIIHILSWMITKAFETKKNPSNLSNTTFWTMGEQPK